MEKRREEILVPFVLAVGMLFLFGYRAAYCFMAKTEILGLLIGLLMGQIGVYILVIASGNDRYKRLLKLYHLCAFFGVLVIAAFFSKYFSYGYFGGFGLMLCFGYSLYTFLGGEGR